MQMSGLCAVCMSEELSSASCGELARRRMICVFEAPDAESVRESLLKVGVQFDRVWTAQIPNPEVQEPIENS